MENSITRIKILLLLFTITLIGCTVQSSGRGGGGLGAAPVTPTQTYGMSRTPFDTRVPFPPRAFMGDGKVHLVYELYMTNSDKPTRKLTKVEVLAENGVILATLQGDDLKANTGRPGAPADLPDTTVIAGNMLAVVYPWVDFNSMNDVPDRLRQKMYFESLDGAPDDELIAAEVIVDKTAVPVITPPVRSGPWYIWDGPSNTPSNHHRHGLTTKDGLSTISQRYAADLEKIGPNSKLVATDGRTNTDWFGYGEDLIAVADGVVTETYDGMPENVPFAKERAVPMTFETVGGNHVVLDVGNGNYVVYAHMIPGSITVKVGDHVTRGQVLGQLGNSGNSDAPHLHFQLCNSGSFIAAEGVPYAIESFTLHGYWELQDWTDAWVPQVGGNRTMDIPMDRAVVTFP